MSAAWIVLRWAASIPFMLLMTAICLPVVALSRLGGFVGDTAMMVMGDQPNLSQVQEHGLQLMRDGIAVLQGKCPRCATRDRKTEELTTIIGDLTDEQWVALSSILTPQQLSALFGEPAKDDVDESEKDGGGA